MNKEVLRLAGLLACVALAATRLGLVAHELVAHGGAALAFGARIDRVQMFWFGGGWIQYTLPEPSTVATLTVTMAGISLEIVLGTAIQLFRGDSLGRRIVRAIGLAIVLHATWYLAIGAFNGFGDGLVLYRLLGQGRVAVAVGAGLVTCLAGYAGARVSFGALLGTLPGSPRRRVLGLVIAVLVASGLHAALTIGELKIRRDATYSRMMTPERDRIVARELEQWQKQQASRGLAPTDADRSQQLVKLRRAHRSFPFALVLAIATALSVVAGAVRSERRAERIPTRMRVRAFIIALAAVWLVIGIDGLIS